MEMLFLMTEKFVERLERRTAQMKEARESDQTQWQQVGTFPNGD